MIVDESDVSTIPIKTTNLPYEKTRRNLEFQLELEYAGIKSIRNTRGEKREEKKEISHGPCSGSLFRLISVVSRVLRLTRSRNREIKRRYKKARVLVEFLIRKSA